MNAYWGYPAAPLLAVISISLLCAVALYQARTFAYRL